MAVVVTGVFMMAGLAGVNLSGLIAGLGITGLALALAAKDTVANIFGAISILIDQPFNVGDWIIVDGVEGEVVTIALRTTLIRTSADTLVTVPNSNITNSSVENFSQRRFRRIKPSYEFEASSDQESIKSFCSSLLEQVTSDPRSMKKDDSWVRISSVGPSKIIVQTNFYCDSSAKSEREMKEDVALMAKSRASEFGLKFHEPRFRKVTPSEVIEWGGSFLSGMASQCGMLRIDSLDGPMSTFPIEVEVRKQRKRVISFRDTIRCSPH